MNVTGDPIVVVGTVAEALQYAQREHEEKGLLLPEFTVEDRLRVIQEIVAEHFRNRIMPSLFERQWPEAQKEIDEQLKRHTEALAAMGACHTMDDLIALGMKLYKVIPAFLNALVEEMRKDADLPILQTRITGQIQTQLQYWQGVKERLQVYAPVEEIGEQNVGSGKQAAR